MKFKLGDRLLDIKVYPGTVAVIQEIQVDLDMVVIKVIKDSPKRIEEQLDEGMVVYVPVVFLEENFVLDTPTARTLYLNSPVDIG
jgi:glutaredoxin